MPIRAARASPLGEFEPRPHGPLGLVLVCPRPAEVGEHAVAHELRDVALVAADHLAADILIASDHLAHVLGIELGRQRGRADQIDEHHRQLPPLGL